MTDRGSSTNGPRIDDELAHEAQSIVQGHGSNAHVEEFRQSEAVPDDTDDDETVAASGYEGSLQDDTTDTTAGSSTSDGSDAGSSTADGSGAGSSTADGSDAVFTTETDEDGGR